jgi:hypothetical protein
VQAAKGRIADWDEFNHLVLENESWSGGWQKIELHERCAVVDESGVYFKGVDAKGNEYLTASLAGSDLASIQLPKEARALSVATI